MLDRKRDVWPAPYEFINETSLSDVVLVCEHASNFIPSEYCRLGLGEDDIQRHIGWDIGAAEVTRGLAQKLGAAALLGNYSRLLIDLNRPLGAVDQRLAARRRSQHERIVQGDVPQLHQMQ